MKLRFLALAALAAGCDVSRSEVHLIPSTFEGDVFIFPEIRTGAAAEREWGAIVFRISEHGILVTQDAPSAAWHLARYYRVLSDGRRELLELLPSSIHDTPENRTDFRPIVWFPRSGSSSGATFPCTVKYEQYYVGSRAALLARTGEDHDRFEKAVRDNRVCQ